MLVNDLQRDVPALWEPIDRLRARHDARAAAAEARAAEAAAREARIAELEAALADAAEHLQTRAAATTSREFVWTPFPKDEKLVQEMARNWEHFAKIPMLHPAGSDAFEAARRACTEVGEPTTLWVLAHGGSEISDIADSGDAEGENHTFLDAAATVERLIADKVPLGFDRIKVWACWAGVSGFAQGFAAALRGHGFAGEVGGYKGITSTPNGRCVHPSVCPVFDDPEDFEDFIDERLDLDEIRLAREVLERFLPAQ